MIEAAVVGNISKPLYIMADRLLLNRGDVLNKYPTEVLVGAQVYLW
jgi:hypothetical protein